MTLTLSLHCWVMGSAHHLTKANIWPKFNKYLSKGSGDMEWTCNSRLKLMTFNCELDLDRADTKFKAQTRDLQLWPWPCPQGWVMGSIHCPTEVNIWPKFGENPPRDKGDRERTQNSRLKPVTLNCDLVSLHGWAVVLHIILLRQTFDQN